MIEISTQPQGFYTDNIHNQINSRNPETLIQTSTNCNPVGEVNDLKKQISQKDYELSLLRVSNSRNQDKVLSLEN